ncbi:hypothetical protein OIV83_001964 [Microbotryomycetes sp. JL201]|nr:hypothetical protein OIV83_001964 [Microbotryomycetes sp. JL201]
MTHELLGDDPRFRHLHPHEYWAKHELAKANRLVATGKRAPDSANEPSQGKRSAADDQHDSPTTTQSRFLPLKISHQQSRDQHKPGNSKLKSCCPANWPNAPPGKRRQFTADDFQNMYNTPQQTSKYLARFPVLQQRNFYVVQQHHATAKHFDLRMQLDGATVSWAIPKGIEGWSGDLQEKRYAIETNPHPINYTLFEGHTLGSTCAWDFGYYVIVPKKRKDLGHDLSDSETTDEECSDEEGFANRHDTKQEDLFAQSYWRTTYRDLPSRYGQPRVRDQADNGHFRQFVVELHGHRYKGLRLRFFRPSHFRKSVKTRKSLQDEPMTTRREYFVALDSRVSFKGKINRAVKRASVLTGRTMQRIIADGTVKPVLSPAELVAFDLEADESDDSDFEGSTAVVNIGEIVYQDD